MNIHNPQKMNSMPFGTQSTIQWGSLQFCASKFIQARQKQLKIKSQIWEGRFSILFPLAPRQTTAIIDLQ